MIPMKYKLNAIALGLLVATSQTQAAETVLISTVSGKNILGSSSQPSISHDGKKVVFTSNAGALVGDTSSLQHVYVKNLLDNTIQRVSIHSNGTKANSINFNPKISGDGRYVVFYSLANNLIDNDTNGVTDVYLHDTVNKTTRLVSSDKNGNPSNAESTEAVVNYDGRYIAFSSLASNLVTISTSGKRNVYVKDTHTGNIEIVSVTNSGAAGDGDSFLPAISGDGRFIAFSSIANNLDHYPANNQYDIYLHDRENKTTERITFAHNGALSNGHSGQVSISDDGNVIAFISLSDNIVSNDKNGQIDIFIHDRTTGETKRIASSLGEPNGPSFYPQVSGNGRFVAFYSGASNLVSNDKNSRNDLFVYDRYLETITLASVATDGKQIDNNIDSVFSINFDGTGAAFATSSSLSSVDSNKQIDVYLRLLDTPINSKPVAKAEPVPSQACSNGGATVTLDASASTDVDKDELSYLWSGPFGNLSGKVVDVFLGPGTHSITLTVTDSHGDSHSQNLSVSITDTTAPSVDAGAPATLEATSTSGASYSLNYTASDNCELANISISPSLNIYPLGQTNITVAASDTLGNTASNSTTVTVQDTTAPVITAPDDIDIEANAIKSVVSIGNAQASDIFPVTITNNAPTEYPLGETIVKWSAVDSNANSASDNQIITVKDTTAPILQLPPDKTVEATAPSMSVDIGAASASDIFLASITNDAPALFPMGTTQVTWSAADSSGNQTNAIQHIHVLDRIAPNLELNSNAVLEATSTQGAQYVIQYTTSDSCINCGDVNVSFDPELNYYPLGNTTVHVTAIDASSNATVKEVAITVQDTTPPELTAPADITQEANALLSSVVLNEASASDIFPVSISNNAPTGFALGNTIVTWTARDANGNQTTTTQNVTITDLTAPTLDIPEDIEIEANAILSTVNLGSATANDIFDVSINNDAPPTYPLGTSTVTWTATDANGNKTTASQKVTVIDTTAPVLSIPDNLQLEATGRYTPVAIGQASATDIFKYEISNNAPASYPLGDTLITWTAVDVNGNKTTATQKVTIVDTTPPAINAGTDITLEAVSRAGTPFKPAYQASDICDCGELKVDISPFLEHYPLGETVLTVTATDISGNSASDSMRLTVVDTTNPELQIPANIVMEATGKLTPVFIGEASATDIFNLNITHNAPPAFPLGNSIITWTATDENGNATSKDQQITIIDTTPPVFELNILKDKLWPAHHKMIHVGNVENISDLVDEKPMVDIQISSNADHQRKKHESDWEIVETDNTWQIWLRAEKSRHAREDRIYNINVTVTDFIGNQSQQTAEVIVPHHREHERKKDHERRHHDREEHGESKNHRHHKGQKDD